MILIGSAWQSFVFANSNASFFSKPSSTLFIKVQLIKQYMLQHSRTNYLLQLDNEGELSINW